MNQDHRPPEDGRARTTLLPMLISTVAGIILGVVLNSVLGRGSEQSAPIESPPWEREWERSEKPVLPDSGVEVVDRGVESEAAGSGSEPDDEAKRRETTALVSVLLGGDLINDMTPEFTGPAGEIGEHVAFLNRRMPRAIPAFEYEAIGYEGRCVTGLRGSKPVGLEFKLAMCAARLGRNLSADARQSGVAELIPIWEEIQALRDLAAGKVAQMTGGDWRHTRDLRGSTAFLVSSLGIHLWMPGDDPDLDAMRMSLDGFDIETDRELVRRIAEAGK